MEAAELAAERLGRLYALPIANARAIGPFALA
jgi:hypothetical protein